MVFLAMVIMLLPWLGLTLFSSKGEPREAIVAVSMLQSGNWILPVNYGIDIPFKPPFLAWLIAIIAKAFNGGVVTEMISRIPSALAAIAMVLCGYSWARKARGEHFAVVFAMVTATCSEVFRSAIVCRLDMVLTACIVCAIYIMYNLHEYQGKLRGMKYTAVIILLTCATLTKGPVGSLLPCLIMGIYCLLRGDRFFPTLFRLIGICLASFIVPALWYYAAWLEGGQHFLDLALEENIGRLTGTMSYDSHVKPFWYNFETLAIGLSPWTLLLLFALIFSIRRLEWHPFKPAGMLAITAAIIVVGFYCIPESKRSVYLLPAYPFICYGITCVIDSIGRTKVMKAYTWTLAIIAIVGVVALIATQFIDLGDIKLDEMPLYGYFILVLPILAAILWMLDRSNAITFTMLITTLLYIAYNAVIAPMVFNPLSDYAYVKQLKPHADKGLVYSIATNQGMRFYTLNYYLGDKLRTIDNMQQVADKPAGTIVLIHDHVEKGDSTIGVSNNYHFVTLTERGCDHRNRIVMAYKDK
jgi:4-amino-4-deoxy-L-arabinose transferase-like glycosyltransferase